MIYTPNIGGHELKAIFVNLFKYKSSTRIEINLKWVCVHQWNHVHQIREWGVLFPLFFGGSCKLWKKKIWGGGLEGCQKLLSCHDANGVKQT